MSVTIQPGTTATMTYRVPPTKTVRHLFDESPEFAEFPAVFATGFLVGLLEWACTRTLAPHLTAGEGSLGVHVDIRHEAPTPPGFEVTVSEWSRPSMGGSSPSTSRPRTAWIASPSERTSGRSSTVPASTSDTPPSWRHSRDRPRRLARDGETHAPVDDAAGDDWSHDRAGVDWAELSDLYRLAPLGDKPPADLEEVFANSRFVCFVRSGWRLIGAGRALADGVDCAYIADVVVRPGEQGRGLGRAIVTELVRLAADHKKVILYAAPGKEGFYERLGFLPMRTAMAMFRDNDAAVASGILARPA